jgi:hypothetical protein
MPRPRKNVVSAPSLRTVGGLMGWAEALGHALGQGVARGLNGPLTHPSGNGEAPLGPRKRGRLAKAFTSIVAAGNPPLMAQCRR